MNPQKARPARSAPVTLKWRSHVIPMIQERNGVWRLRSRSKSFPVDIGLNTDDITLARQRGREALDMRSASGPAKGSLKEAVEAYLKIPRKNSLVTAKRNVWRLGRMVRQVLGLDLDKVSVSILPAFWGKYVAFRQGAEHPDYSRQTLLNDNNNGINSALKQAGAIFRKKLHHHYLAHGIILPEKCHEIDLLPALFEDLPPVDDAGLIAAWEPLRETNTDLWITIGLARFAGLRLGEIIACRGKWIEPRGEGAIVRVMDRRGDKVLVKTGARYTPVILHAGLASHLLSLPQESFVINPSDRYNWPVRVPQRWLKQFTGTARYPLHRLRALYLENVARLTEDAITAKLAGIKAAQEAAGHTTAGTTLKHYLPHDETALPQDRRRK